MVRYDEPVKTPQETFDHVCTALIAQGQPARDDDYCRYRAGDLKCAAGHCIPDEKYDPEMEGIGLVDEILEDWPEAFNGHDLDVLRRLQAAHDHGSNKPDGWLERFVSAARDYACDAGLDATVLGDPS